ncbi:TetR family transcriptional regulator C-terminal domain-containing protein [Flavobacterium sp. 3HN19-14]|uniref:TetR family transcriptional regulator C-terminal domain-containing protein n=1 Tax=Flavobacterium sp. 3HN19-14 TaxID=3448133 RepID=UPI003EE0547F
MATKKTTAQKPLLDDNQIIALYMQDVMESNNQPLNVYTFCKKNGIEESEFYTFFNSLEGIKAEIWVKFFENAIATIENEKGYVAYTKKNKLLTLYFTLFEILTLNRSYVVYTLDENKEGLKNLKQLKGIRNHFRDFIVNVMEAGATEKMAKVQKVTKPVFAEGAWIQFLFILKFWLDDTSKGFEKTDILIEKSVNTAVDLLDTKPLENLFDLGKFLFKEAKMR